MNLYVIVRYIIELGYRLPIMQSVLLILLYFQNLLFASFSILFPEALEQLGKQQNDIGF